jgi:hypothetical protein
MKTALLCARLRIELASTLMEVVAAFGDGEGEATTDATAVQTFRQIMRTSRSVLLLMLAVSSQPTPSQTSGINVPTKVTLF